MTIREGGTVYFVTRGKATAVKNGRLMGPPDGTVVWVKDSGGLISEHFLDDVSASPEEAVAKVIEKQKKSCELARRRAGIAEEKMAALEALAAKVGAK